jgi:hypothetical protein
VFSSNSGDTVTDIVWSSWTDSTAIGRGTWASNSCDPSCALGKVTDYPTTVTLADPVGGRFARLIQEQTGPYGKTYTYNLPDPNLQAFP